MDSFTCPVCKNGTVVFDEKGKKGACDNCETTFVAFDVKNSDRVELRKLGDKQYLDAFKELESRDYDPRGLPPHIWNRIAEGGLTDREQEKIDQEQQKIAEQEEKTRKAEIMKTMIATTTPDIEGHPIKEYKGIVTGQVAAGINVFKDAFAGIRNIVGGRSNALQETMKKMRDEALKEIKEEAVEKGANAIVAISLDFDEYAEGMLLLTVTGTAVVI